MTVVDLVVLSLATLYLSIVVSNEYISGPFNILARIRRAVGVRNGEDGLPAYQSGSLADLLTCPYCNSLWFGLFLTVIFLGVEAAGFTGASWLLAPLAASGFVVLVQELKS